MEDTKELDNVAMPEKCMDESDMTQRHSHSEESTSPNTGLILLVEDNPDDVELTLRAFKRKGFINRIVILRDGVQALDYLNRTGEYSDVEDPRPTLVLLDLKLP